MMNEADSMKSLHFLSEYNYNKPNTDIPGINEKIGRELKEAGYATARDVMRRYLFLGSSLELFKDWLYTTTSANSKQAVACYSALQDYCRIFKVQQNGKVVDAMTSLN